MATSINLRPSTKSQEWVKRDTAVMSPSFTRTYPFVMDHGKGSEVWDVDGNRYIDMNATIAVASTGHCHPKVVEAIKHQADRYLHYGAVDFYTLPTIELAEKLISIAPMQEESQVFFANSGTEAVEAAIKLARYHSHRPNFIAFLGGFHGRTMGSLAFTASKYTQRKGFAPLTPGVFHVPYPYAYRPLLASRPGQEYGDAVIDYIKNQIFRQLTSPEEVAAILIEPIQGEGGYVVPTPNFLRQLRELCDEHGILLIADEVQSGVGRTGKWWAIEHWDVEPDVLVTAKGVASGLPMGVMLARKSLMTWGPGAHANTFGGNPIAAAAAMATIDVIESEGLLEHAAEMGEYLMDALSEIQMRHPTLGDVRGKGLMVAAEFVLDRDSKEPAHDLSNDIVNRAFDRGLLILPCGQNSVRFSPPLNIPKSLIDEGLELFETAVTEAEAAL